MKRILAALLSVLLLLTLLPVAVLAASPADYGWNTDKDDFTGWTATATAVSGDYGTTHNSHRLWKRYIEDEDNFSASLRVTVDAQSSAFVKVLGVTIELDGRHGNGNQAYVKLGGSGYDWVSGTDCKMQLQIVRKSGGTLAFTVSGEGNDSPMVLTAVPTESSTNIEVGLYAGKATFADIAVTDPSSAVTHTVTWDVNGKQTEEVYAEGAMPVFHGSTAKAPDAEYGYEFTGWMPALGPVTEDITYTAQYRAIPIGEYIPTQTPGDFGWQTDKTGGEMDFSGWTATDAENLTCDYAASVNSHRVWKALPGDTQTFTVALTVTVYPTSSVFFKVFGQILELDGRGGNGNQAYIKQNGKGQSWYNTMGGVVHLTLLRENGGDVQVWLAGENTQGVYRTAITPTEQNPNFELGVYAGTAAFENIRMTASAVYPADTSVDLDLRGEPFSTVRFTNFADPGLIVENIGFYQAKPVTQTSDAADLEIIGIGADALNDFSAEELTAVLRTLKTEKNVIVLVGAPALPEDVGAEVLADRQLAVRRAAEEFGAIYVNAFAVTKNTPWCVRADGTLTDTGAVLVADAVFAALCKRCTCLAARAQRPLDTDCVAEQFPTTEMLEGLCTCTGIQELADILDSCRTDLDLTLYHSLSGAEQTAVCTAFLAADRGSITDWQDADLLFETVCIQTVCSAAKTPVFSGKIKKYVAVGDSITEGVGASTKNCCWANIFASMIEDLQGQQITFLNKGVGGTTMSSIVYNGRTYESANTTLQSFVLDNAPDLVTVSYGVNDLYYGVSFEQFCADYDLYLRTLRKALPDAAVLVCGIGFVGSDFRCTDILKWNAAIRSMAESYGAVYVDTYHALRTTEWLLGDDLHPMDTGYYVMADTLLRALGTVCDLTDSACPHTDTELRDALAATCTEPGYTGDTYCADCGELLAEGTAIEALGHDFADGFCTRCGAEDPNYIPPADPCEGYTDIDRNAWYHPYADFVIERGLMGTTGSGLTFEPSTACTRGMIVTVLYSLAGKPEVKFEAKFPDVKDKQWYTAPVLWAYQNNIVSGYDTGYFGTNDKVTREQLAVIFKAYAEKIEKRDTTARADLSGFADSQKTTWSKAAMAWAVAAGLISGKPGANGTTLLDPQGKASRAEVAVILMKFLNN